MASKRKLIIDTDAGVDDAQAILMALSVPDVEIIAITCVAGNANVFQVGRNVLRVLQVAERLQVPVYVGCNEPLLGNTKPRSDYHGSDGFGDVPDANAPDDSHIQQGHAVEALIRLTKEHAGDVSLVCIGPLTNIAMAIRMDPGFGLRLKHCYIMGGNYLGKGNMTPSAEFNFYYDAESAYVTLNQLKAPITLVPWEVCDDNTLSWDWYEEFHNINSAATRFIAKLERHAIERHYKSAVDQQMTRGYEIVDQYALAAAIFDDVISDCFETYATVEIQSCVTQGQLVVDWSNVLKKDNNDIYTSLREEKTVNSDFLGALEKKSVIFSKEQNWKGFVPADEILLACALNDDVIESSSDVYATVEVKGEYTWGQMVVDWNSVLKKSANMKLVTGVHKDKYLNLLYRAVGRSPPKAL